MFAPPTISIDLERVVANAERLKRQAQAGFVDRKVQIFFALKAHPASRVLEVLQPLGIGCEVMTPRQLLWATELGIPTIASGLFKPPGIVEAGPRLRYLVLETPYEIERLSQAAVRAGRAIRVAVRIRALASSKIGCELEDVHHLNRWPGIEIVGVHFHAGWNVRDDAAIRGFVAKMVEMREALIRLGHRIMVLNFGGSLCEPSIDADQLGRRLAIYREAVDDTTEEIHLEPGRYLVGDAGRLACTVEFVDRANRRLYVNTCAYGYRLTGATPRVELVGGKGHDPRPWSIHGFWPSDSDVLSDVALVGSPAAGDRLLLHNMGAYVLGLEAQFALTEPIQVLYS